MGKVLLAVAVIAALAAAWWLLRPPPPPPPAPTTPYSIPAAAPAASPAPAAVSGPGAAPADPSAPAAAPAPPTDSLSLVGRVVDPKRFPVPGATVALRLPGGTDLRGTSGPDGQFRIDGIPRSDPSRPGVAALLARAPDGRAGLAQIWFGPGVASPIRVDAIVVDASLALAVRVARDGAPVAGARVHLCGNGAWILDGAAGPDGIARFEALPKGPWSLLARAEEPSAAGRADLLLGPDLPQPFEVAVKEARSIEVRAVAKDTAAPVAGATFQVILVRRNPGFISSGDPGPMPPVAPTDAEGRTRIAGTCPDDELHLAEPSAPGFFAANLGQRTGVKPGQTEATIELVGAREVRFPVEEGEIPPPPDGSRIALEPQPGSMSVASGATGRMEGSTLVLSGVTSGYVMAIAVAPDGARARLWADDKGTAPKPVQFRRGRTVEVTARRPDGTPVEGASFNLRNQGNNILCPPFRSGPDGVARAEGLYGELSEVYLLAGEGAAMAYSVRSIGSVDLTKGDARLEAVVPFSRAFVLRVTVDGKPALPPRFSASVHGIILQEFEEDPVKGEIRGAVPVEAEAKSVQASLAAQGWLPAQAIAEAGDGTAPLIFDLAVEAGGSLHVPVSLPADKRCRLSVQMQDPERGWMHVQVGGNMMMGTLAPGPDGILRAEPLKPGRYRLLETSTGVSTEPAEVRAGATATLPPFDLSKQGIAKGKVVVPEGIAMTEIRVLLEGQGVEAAPLVGGFDRQPSPVRPDGTFQIRVPGDRPVTVRPWHPTLVPAAQGGKAEVTEPREDLVLRLEVGRTARLRLSPVPKVNPSVLGGGGVRVLLYRGEPTGSPVSEHPAVREGDGFVFGGYPVGTWTLWIDPGSEFAPAIVKDAVLGEEGADLGTVALVEGSRVRVKVLVKEGQAVPRIGVWATREDAPKYTRGINTWNEDLATAIGFGPGRFRITAFPQMGTPGAKGSLNEVREIDGVNDLELTMDLR